MTYIFVNIMRIGILTYHCPPNFGAQLQAVSTIGYLKRMGHEPIIINWYAKDLEEMYSHRIPRNQLTCHEKFTKQCFPLSKKCQTEDELITEIDALNLDGIVVGSDALFKYQPLNTRRVFSKRKLKYIYHDAISCEMIKGNPFFGLFIDKLKRFVPAVAYAVSSQNCPFRRMQKKEKILMADALSHFINISVRDLWTKDMVEYVTGGKNVRICPDPVFSFNQNCIFSIPSKKEITAKYKLKDNYVLFSFSEWYVSANYINSIAKEFECHGVQPVGLPMPEKLFHSDINKNVYLPISPIDWYALIIHSQGYVGERMHPIIVCLHNSIPFFVFDEYGIKEKKGFIKKKLIYNCESSKTYAIVSEADFIDNLHSYKSGLQLPCPKYVWNMIHSFDKLKCQQFSLTKQMEYEKGMNESIQYLKIQKKTNYFL